MISYSALSRHSFAGVNLEGMPPTHKPMPTTLEKHKYFQRISNDMQWEGDPLYLKYQQLADSYLKRHNDGDLYDPPF